MTSTQYDLIQELKRLQKEIEEANEEIRCNTTDSWNGHGLDLKEHSKLYELMETNQQRIKEIIEQL